MSAIGLFQRMSQGVLALLGEPALFGGTNAPTKINIQYGVQLAGLNGDNDYSEVRDVATVDIALNPQLHDRFSLLASDGVSIASTWRLEKRIRDNGVNRQFVVMKVA